MFHFHKVEHCTTWNPVLCLLHCVHTVKQTENRIPGCTVLHFVEMEHVLFLLLVALILQAHILCGICDRTNERFIANMKREHFAIKWPAVH